MRSRSWFPLLVIVAASICGLLVVEVAARLLHPEATRAAIRRRIDGERADWRRPDASFHHVGDGIFRLQFARETDDSGERLMIVGDSFAMGHGVGQEARFGTLLGRNLGPALEVDVLATSSYSPIVYRNIVRRALSTTRYAAVAVFVDQTDPADDVIYRNDLLPGEGSRVFDVRLMADRDALVGETYDRIVDGLSGWKGLARRSAVFNLLSPPTLLRRFPADNPHYRYLELSLARGPLVHAFDVQPGAEATRAMEALLLRHVDEIVASCGERGVPLILAANPWEHHVSDAASAAAGPAPRENRLERVLAERYGERPGVIVLELTRAFREHRDPSSLFLDRPSHEIHWNAAGHRLVEQTLREALLEHVLHPAGSGRSNRPAAPRAIRGGSK